MKKALKIIAVLHLSIRRCLCLISNLGLLGPFFPLVGIIFVFGIQPPLLDVLHIHCGHAFSHGDLPYGIIRSLGSTESVSTCSVYNLQKMHHTLFVLHC